MTRRLLHCGWGLLIGALIGVCGVVWMELHQDVWVGAARAYGMGLIAIAICERRGSAHE